MEKEKRRTDGIQIDDKYGIVVMPIDYALAKVKKDKSGTVYYTPFHFLGSIQSCLNDYLKESVHDELNGGTSISLDEAAEQIAKACARVAQAIEKAFPEYEVIKKE